MRVVLDTNTIISGLLWFGKPRKLIDLAEAGSITVCTSPDLLRELREVLIRPKLSGRLAAVGSSAEEVVEQFAALAQVVEVSVSVTVITADPDDNNVLSCALAAQADYIVSGDRHLLDLASYEGVEILDAAQFLVKVFS
ncbi:MAG: putative toxin-antitoxin system toxin component, PIN family [Chloroflexi bacterium]|nr:MAG: putative toxin-antitoxin system toxin component, PIN family [Chloroflexota bacterium]